MEYEQLLYLLFFTSGCVTGMLIGIGSLYGGLWVLAKWIDEANETIDEEKSSEGA